MPIFFIFAILLFVAALIGLPFFIMGIKTDNEDMMGGGGFFLFGGIVLGGLCLLISSVAIVGTKEVGIVTSFNKPVASLDNGFHFIAPWETTTEMDAAIQTDQHDQGNHDCVNARIAHQIIACVDVTVRWRIRESAADELFRDYRDFDNVRNSLVTRELATDINAQFSEYDPLAVDSNGNTTAPSLNSLRNVVVVVKSGRAESAAAPSRSARTTSISRAGTITTSSPSIHADNVAKPPRGSAISAMAGFSARYWVN